MDHESRKQSTNLSRLGELVLVTWLSITASLLICPRSDLGLITDNVARVNGVSVIGVHRLLGAIQLLRWVVGLVVLDHWDGVAR